MEGLNEKLIKVAVLGVGGCGGNVLVNVYEQLKALDLPVEFSLLNTDVQALNFACGLGFPKERIFQIGERSTGGLGAGSNFEVGKAAAQEDIELLRRLISGKDLVIVVAGLGGGTGSGAVPVVLKEAKDANALTLSWFITPLEYEGYKRNEIAKKTIKEADGLADSYMVISNDAPESLIFKDSMEEINTAISLGIQIVLEVLMRSSLINLDFADFTTVVKNGGRALFSFASYDGEKRDEKSVKEILKMSLQPQTSLKKIQKSILFVRGGADMKKDELKNVMTSVQKRLADDALVILGVAMREGKQSLDIVFLGTVGSKEEKT